MNRIYAISIFLLSFIIAGCEQYVVDEALMQKEDVSLVIRGEVVLEYEGNTCQMAYNAKRCEYRMMDDDMAHYFILSCNADLSDVGQEVTADLMYTTVNDIRAEKGLTFKVERYVPSTDMFWLWCQSKRIGVVVRKI